MATMPSSIGVEALAPRRLLHRFDGIARQIEKHLLDLHLVGEHGIQGRIERKADPNAMFLGANESKRACLLDQLVDAFDPPLSLAAHNEVARASDDLSRTQRL